MTTTSVVFVVMDVVVCILLQLIPVLLTLCYLKF
jgi:hypothetical protein